VKHLLQLHALLIIFAFDQRDLGGRMAGREGVEP